MRRTALIRVVFALCAGSVTGLLIATASEQGHAEHQHTTKVLTGGVVAVVDSGGHVIALERLDGTFPAAAEVAVGKARTAALFRRPTSFFEDVITKNGRTSMVARQNFTPLQGGVPIVVDGEVTYIESRQVRDAFAKGAPLVELEEYKVHASRRERPGEAEVHTRETDVVYVLDGEATLVTGGEVVDAKETAPDEIRGRAIRGDEVVPPGARLEKVAGGFLFAEGPLWVPGASSGSYRAILRGRTESPFRPTSGISTSPTGTKRKRS